MTKINTARIDKSFEDMEKDFLECKKWKTKLVNSANKYFEILKPILRKRGIKIKSTQMYYNDGCKRALVHVDFEKEYSGYTSTKVKNLEKEIRSAKIPCPAGSSYRGVTITLYKGVLFGERR